MTGADRNVSNVDFTKTQLGVLLMVTLLAVDAINPVKLFLHVFPAIAPWHVATMCLLLATYIFISEFKALLYFCAKTFFQSILSIFFRDVEIIGRDNIPRRGPVIFSVNHANQFIDAVTLSCTCHHSVSLLMAEKSWNRRIIGDIAWALDVVPVKRPQDSAIMGKGLVSFTQSEDFESTPTLKVQGEGTAFSEQLQKGDKIRPKGTATAVKVAEIVSDTSLVLDASLISPEELTAAFSKDAEPAPFDILQRVDQKVVYGKVLDKLASGGCVGIFPEGGSHDRTDLLPLKVGVALIAYSALEEDALTVPIVPVGLSYFHAHRWRGRAVVEYGQPIYIEPKTLPAYKAGGQERRKVCNELLDRIQDSMKSVIVSAPDYDTLQIIHTARRLYQRQGTRGKEKQDLSRRFAEGYKRLMTMARGDPPEAWLDLQRRVQDYRSELRYLGIRDYQVSGLDREKTEISQYQDIDADGVLKEIRLPYQIAHLIVVLMLAAIPTLFLNLPVGILAGIYSERRRETALKNSKVKIRGYDVMLTEKVMFCIVAIPIMWFLYGMLFYFCTDFDGPTITLCILSLPLFAYVGIIVSEAGMVDIKDLRPYYMRLFPSSRRRLKALPEIRKSLQADLRAFIRELGPALGDIYYGKELDWKDIQEKSRLVSQEGVENILTKNEDTKKDE